MDFLLELNWLAIGQIILIDLLLGGDNAIVIALACRNLPRHLRARGILWGTIGAIVIRILLITFAMNLLQMAYIKLLGGLLLLWIGIKLFSENDPDHESIQGSEKLITAIRTIVLADMVMSIDNVVAVASAAAQAGGSQIGLVVFGILVSVPIIVWGSALVMAMMNRFPFIIFAGAGLLGYLGGAMMFTDVAIAPWAQAHWPYHELHFPLVHVHFSLPGVAGAGLVLALGHWLARDRGPAE